MFELTIICYVHVSPYEETEHFAGRFDTESEAREFAVSDACESQFPDKICYRVTRV